MVKTKGGFFQKVRCVFQISKKDTPKTILNLKFKFPANSYTVIGGKFKFQAQDSFLEYFYFGDLEIWKTSGTFRKKNTFRKPKTLIFTQYLRRDEKLFGAFEMKWGSISSSQFTKLWSTLGHQDYYLPSTWKLYMRGMQFIISLVKNV